ncbi:MFS transporter [Arachnia propionica]|uniref:MFS transporter n=1 Tax=Arachnia propionica TaxID=1750 RepID=A0A3P1WR24_9ACTN|nr:MFS transporter [Arachnia propionica]RRD49062.1 MFS transporter [Arachnia propionica]
MSPLHTPRQRWLLLATVSVGLLMITMDNSILYTALPTLTSDLGASTTQGLWIINAYPLVMAGLLLGSGTLGDRFGHRRLFLVGLVIFGAASLLAAFSPNPATLIAARAVLAVGAACMMPATLALIRLSFDDVRERNLAIGVWGSVAVIGMAGGPIVGGILLEHFWWGSVFLINVPVVIAALIAIPMVASPSPVDRSRRWDWTSSVWALLTLTGAVLAVKELAHLPPSWPMLTASLAMTLLFGFLFVRRQRRLTHPLLDFSLFGNAAFSTGVATAALSMFAVGGLEMATTQRFQLVAGYSPLQAGLVVTAVALGSLPTSLLSGALLHILGLRIIVGSGFAVGTIGMACALAGAHHRATWLLVTGLVVAGAGLGATMSVASTAIIGNAPPNRAGMASSVEEVSYEFGGLFAIAVLGSLLSAIYSATIQPPPTAPSAVRESITAAHATGDPTIIAIAATAFDGAYATVLGIITVVLTIATLVTTVTLRHYGIGSRASRWETNDH